MKKDNLNLTIGEEVMQEKTVEEKELKIASELHSMEFVIRKLNFKKKINQSGKKIFRTKSEKNSSSQHSLSDISQKLSYAKLKNKIYQLIEGTHNSLMSAYNKLCTTNDSESINFVTELLKKKKIGYIQSKQDLREAEIEFNQLQEAYQKSKKNYQKIRLMKHMI